MDKIHFENQYAKVYLNQSLNTVFLEYKAKVPSHKDFIEVNTKVISCFEAANTQKMVADIRKMGILALESQQWVAEVLLPSLIKHLKGKPLIHAQLLDQKDILVKVSANGVKQRSTKAIENFELHQFSDRDELEKFLKSQP
ncbi:MAG: hypothetical protein LW721_17910 [Flammeovirgaceae bacterium]|jgi:hypothetical protein|nr:hypothetical protein [Flammeovirgaceae bacterium]